MAKKPTIEIPPLVNAYLDALAELGVYGDTPGRVATFILRKEIMHLLETNRLDPISKKLLGKTQEMPKSATEEGDEEDA